LDGQNIPVDYAANARSLGAHVITASNVTELKAALAQARKEKRTTVVVVETDMEKRVPGYESWWDVPISQVSEIPAFDLPGKALNYRQVLDEIKETGYAGTELGDWGFLPTQPIAVRRELDSRSLELVGAFVPVAFRHEEAYADGEARALRTARLMADAVGTDPFLVLSDDNGKDPTRTKLAGRIQPEHSLTPEEWNGYGERVNKIAAAVKQHAGLRCVFHHHCAGFVEAPWEIEALLQHTDPALLGLCFDTGHYHFGGGTEPVKLLHRFRDRVWHVHFKDCDANVHRQSRDQGRDYFDSLKNAIFCELGQGAVPFDAVMTELREAGYQGWIY
jgi:inosose dehydratase